MGDEGADIPVVLWILASGKALLVVVQRGDAIEGIHLLSGFIFRIGKNAICGGEVATS